MVEGNTTSFRDCREKSKETGIDITSGVAENLRRKHSLIKKRGHISKSLGFCNEACNKLRTSSLLPQAGVKSFDSNLISTGKGGKKGF